MVIFVIGGGGQDARATVARAFCPELSVTKSCANLTLLGVSPNTADLAHGLAKDGSGQDARATCGPGILPGAFCDEIMR